VWTAHRYASGDPTDGGKAQIPTLNVRQAEVVTALIQLAVMNQEKSHLFRATFFSELTQAKPDMPPPDYPKPKFAFTPVTDEQIHCTILKLGPHKAPIPDGIPIPSSSTVQTSSYHTWALYTGQP